MCGIAGILVTREHREPTEPSDALLRMLRAQAHRGPDGQGQQVLTGTAATLHLGHRRLAIFSTDATGHQPMADASGRYVISFNGAIYNYRELAEELSVPGERARSDTAVLLAAWAAFGPAALDRLNGMFAFALWDRVEQTLYLCRDRFGEKPLHYLTEDVLTKGVRLLFGSEIKGLFAAGPHMVQPAAQHLDTQALLEFLATHDVDHQPGRTLFRHVRALPPGCFARLAPGLRLSLHRYYQVAGGPLRSLDAAQDETGGETLVRETRALLADAVSLRLRADVETSCSVSGGLDSSVIAAIAAGTQGSAGSPYPAFSCQFPQASMAGDESGWARQLHEHLSPKLRLHVITPTADEVEASMDRLLFHQEAPCADASIAAHYHLMQGVRAAGQRVILSGQGGDEVFGGYPSFARVFLGELLQTRQWMGLWGELAARAGQTGESLLPLAAAALYHALPNPLRQRIYAFRRRSALALRPEGKRLLAMSAPRFSHAPPELCAEDGPTFSHTQRYLLSCLSQWSLPHILRHDDRNSMAFGIESRAPYLDHRLLALSMRVTPRSLLGNGWGKRLLRLAASELLPPAMTWRVDKRGFFSPQADWLWALEARVRQTCQPLPAPLDEMLWPRATQALLDGFYREKRAALADPVWLLWMGCEYVTRTVPRLIGAASSAAAHSGGVC